ncbi:sphingomyelin phosphodiesterase [Mycena rebaudengoi]|nr:sphingomyelin phosphodiesterase [Mycena rebaudengoi]
MWTMWTTAFAMLPWVVAVSKSPPSTFTVPGAFPTSLFDKYYNNPTQTASQVQPVVTDPVSHETYKLSLTHPDTIPLNNTVDPHPLPPVASSSKLLEQAFAQIVAISTNPMFTTPCAKCQAGLEVAKFLAMASPENGPTLAVQLCFHFKFSSDCGTTFSKLNRGGLITQVIANANVGGYDGQMICQSFLNNLCPLPPASPLNLTAWFSKPKPNPLPTPKKPSGKRLKVLHVSDFHLDPRYATGAEANCTSTPCCRHLNVNVDSPNVTLTPAPRFGYFRCDTPMALGVASLQAIPPLTGTEKTGFAFSVYTGDLVAHDPDNKLSRAFIEYTETIVYDLFKRTLGSGPVYAVLGNHDSYNEAQDAPHSLGGKLADQFSWQAVKLARAHYSAFMRVISLNTDICAITLGMLRFLTDELQDAEDAGDRVWIIGHVLSGWDGSNPLVNPTDLFYQIVDRYSPHVIANILFGHSHEDQLSIFYANNATAINAQTAQAVSWVDSSTFDVVDAFTWRSDVNTYAALDSQTEFGPTYEFEYSTRETYGKAVPGWGPNDPLNATWWHRVTEAMEADSSLVKTFHTLQGKTSVRTQACSDDCVKAKICYMRSGSAAIAKQNCAQGFGSVQ